MTGAALKEDDSIESSPVVPGKPSNRALAVTTSLVSGAIAGAIAKTVIAPLDRTKIFFQISDTPYSWKSALDFIRSTLKTSGVAALWRGNSATMARIIPYSAVQFAAHEQWKRILAVDTPKSAKKRPLLHLVAGSLAGVTSQSATYPLDLARARMSVYSVEEYRTLTAVFRKMLREDGFRSLYRGYPATVVGIIPYAGVSFFTYDTLKHKHLELNGVMPTGWMNLLFGGCAGMLGQTSSYPLDVIRRRMQTTRVRRPTTLATITQIWTNAGWRGFFKGLSMNWLKGPIAVGVSFSTFDAVRSNLRKVAETWGSSAGCLEASVR